MKKKNQVLKAAFYAKSALKQKGQQIKRAAAAMALMGISAASFAGGGVSAINSAQTDIATYLQPVSDLCLAIGAVVGIAGGIRIFIKWNGGEREINKEVIGWMGSCVFLISVSVIIKAFFV